MVFGWLRKSREKSPDTQDAELPWGPEGEIAANASIATLRENLLEAIKDDKGVHTESLMVAIGAIAGYAATYMIWETMIRTGKAQLMKDLHVLQGADGKSYYSGDMLNAILLPQAGSRHTIWEFVATGALQAGAAQADLPDIEEIFAHVAGAIGSDAFGVVRVPDDHQPAFTPYEALHAVWPRTREMFASTQVPGAQGRSLAIQHWPVVAAIVAQHYIVMGRDALSPGLSARIVMESAVAMSKIDPITVPDEYPS